MVKYPSLIISHNFCNTFLEMIMIYQIIISQNFQLFNENLIIIVTLVIIITLIVS